MENRRLHGRSIRDVAEIVGDAARGVFLRSLTRMGREVPLGPDTRVYVGDVMTLVGSTGNIARATKQVGHALNTSDRTDIAFLAIGIAVGLLAGLVSFKVGTVALTLGGGGGALIAGLVCGWLRSRNPTMGALPPAAQQTLSDLGLGGFIAAIGLGNGLAAWSAIQAHGLLLVGMGVVVTLVPLTVAERWSPTICWQKSGRDLRCAGRRHDRRCRRDRCLRRRREQDAGARRRRALRSRQRRADGARTDRRRCDVLRLKENAMRRILAMILATALLLLAAFETPARAEDDVRIQEEIWALPLPLPMFAYLVRPVGDGPFPLVIMNHGVSLNPTDRSFFPLVEFRDAAKWFARRGLSGGRTGRQRLWRGSDRHSRAWCLRAVLFEGRQVHQSQFPRCGSCRRAG